MRKNIADFPTIFILSFNEILMKPKVSKAVL